ncbi:MAG: SNF2-related protein, partial [Bacteroidales bacterium]|nr:SNF2-related protein [Bacteroidales bacterium]
MLLKVKPSEAQERGAAFLLERDAGALFYATGSGKSVIQIMVAFAALEHKLVDKFIIVATVSSALEIKNDFKMHTDVVPFVIDSIEDVETFATDPSNQIGIVKYNMLMRVVSVEGKVLGGLSERGNLALGKLFNGHQVGFSFDEIHTLKNPKASVTTFYRLLRGYMSLCYGVTATGVMSNIYDLYHILSFIKPGCLGSISKFNSLYVDRELKLLPNGRRIWEVLSLKNLEALEKATAAVSLKYYPERDVEFIKIESELGNKEEYLKAAKGILEEIEKE